MLLSILPLQVCNNIAALAPPLASAGSDSIIWCSSHDGAFSLHSSYQSLAKHLELHEDHLFRLIWRWKGLERIRVFMWQEAIDPFPTNLFHFNRHITDDAICSHCNLDVHEPVMHVLHDCPCLGDFCL